MNSSHHILNFHLNFRFFSLNIFYLIITFVYLKMMNKYKDEFVVIIFLMIIRIIIEIIVFFLILYI